MGEKENETAGVSAETDGSSRWATIAVLVVVLIALCSAIYFVEIRQDELKAANAVGEADAPQEGTNLPVIARPEKD